jgi:hypothetical protein
MTVEEHTKLLEQNPEWVAMMAEKDRKREEMLAFYREMQKPIIKDLESVGIFVKSVWLLGGKGESYQEALPILLKHLPIFYDDRVNSGIARALGRLKPIEHWDILVDLFCKTDCAIHRSFKEGLACALFDTVTKKTMPEYISLLRDKRHGESRILMVGKLRRSKQPEIIALVDELFEDPDLRTEIGSWKRFKGRK